jgi:hypothetical protein
MRVSDTARERITLPAGYPTDLSDEELAAAIQLIIQQRRKWGELKLETIKGEIVAPLLGAGINEQTRRLLDESAAQSRKATRLSLAIALLAVAIALGGIFSDYWSDKSWQDKQTKLLTEIRDRLP